MPSKRAKMEFTKPMTMETIPLISWANALAIVKEVRSIGFREIEDGCRCKKKVLFIVETRRSYIRRAPKIQRL